MRRIPMDQGVPLVAAALAAGAERIGVSTVEWNVAGRCEAPRLVSLTYTPLKAVWRHVARFATEKGSMFMDIQTKCRQCSACLKARRNLWANRAQIEAGASARTWFGTLTLTPARQDWAYWEARSRARARGVDLDAEPEAVRFRARHAVISEEITKYLKRLRKQTGAPMRMLCVVEAHKSGLPHYHLLVHQLRADKPIGERDLRRQWHWGHSLFKLVSNTNKAAWYVSKYLAKSAMARVRASINYGREKLSSTIVEPEGSDVANDSQAPVVGGGRLFNLVEKAELLMNNPRLGLNQRSDGDDLPNGIPEREGRSDPGGPGLSNGRNGWWNARPFGPPIALTSERQCSCPDWAELVYHSEYFEDEASDPPNARASPGQAGLAVSRPADGSDVPF